MQKSYLPRVPKSYLKLPLGSAAFLKIEKSDWLTIKSVIYVTRSFIGRNAAKNDVVFVLFDTEVAMAYMVHVLNRDVCPTCSSVKGKVSSNSLKQSCRETEVCK